MSDVEHRNDYVRLESAIVMLQYANEGRKHALAAVGHLPEGTHCAKYAEQSRGRSSLVCYVALERNHARVDDCPQSLWPLAGHLTCNVGETFLLGTAVLGSCINEGRGPGFSDVSSQSSGI
jgi:hypothetical protein